MAAETIPNTIDQAFVYLDKMLPSKERESFMHAPEKVAVIRAHDGLGMFIRNKWFRSGKSRLVGLLDKAGAQSMDDMSSMVLTSYWRRLNGKPIELEKQGQCFSRWWAEELRLENEAHAKGENSYRGADFSCP